MKEIIKCVVGLIIVILIPILILRMPIKHVEMKINVTDGPKQDLDKDEVTQIYVGNYPEDPGWIVYGKDGVMFKGSNKADHIFVVGNFPNKMNYTLINTNVFVLNGKYIGEKKRKGIVAGCFYVESWGVFGKLKRESGFGDSVSKSSLTIYDQISADPILVYDSDEFENVDDYKTSK
ncbi:hypothetical protein [Clostridium saccharobutylicum]|uniref:Uncharacterized protein n=1 Tax=Clostridium saccharobutylicum TaxID=169679 RepID=A0A1S8N5B9_CLOSA|nr:hypothetical protein [Clostridium saccharobutylicum]OOM11664.1 hypothetical protein CLOSAC_20910 [Clostridium saccharobutylicum]